MCYTGSSLIIQWKSMFEYLTRSSFGSSLTQSKSCSCRKRMCFIYLSCASVHVYGNRGASFAIPAGKCDRTKEVQIATFKNYFLSRLLHIYVYYFFFIPQNSYNLQFYNCSCRILNNPSTLKTNCYGFKCVTLK